MSGRYRSVFAFAGVIALVAKGGIKVIFWLLPILEKLLLRLLLQEQFVQVRRVYRKLLVRVGIFAFLIPECRCCPCLGLIVF